MYKEARHSVGNGQNALTANGLSVLRDCGSKPAERAVGTWKFLPRSKCSDAATSQSRFYVYSINDAGTATLQATLWGI